MIHAGVERRSHQVVGDRNGMNITSEMKVEILHRDNLAVATAGRTTLDVEGRAHAGLANTGYDVLSQFGA